jgi:hypothetical protein
LYCIIKSRRFAFLTFKLLPWFYDNIQEVLVVNLCGRSWCFPVPTLVPVQALFCSYDSGVCLLLSTLELTFFANQHTRFMCGNVIRADPSSILMWWYRSATAELHTQLQTQKGNSESTFPLHSRYGSCPSGLYGSQEMALRPSNVSVTMTVTDSRMIFMAGLPIRLCRAGRKMERPKAVRRRKRTMRETLGVDPDKRLVLVMGGGMGSCPPLWMNYTEFTNKVWMLCRCAVL